MTEPSAVPRHIAESCCNASLELGHLSYVYACIASTFLAQACWSAYLRKLLLESSQLMSSADILVTCTDMCSCYDHIRPAPGQSGFRVLGTGESADCIVTHGLYQGHCSVFFGFYCFYLQPACSLLAMFRLWFGL